VTPGGFLQANKLLDMAYRTALAVIEEGGIREDAKGETTIRDGATYL
jgi:hypothetical protein